MGGALKSVMPTDVNDQRGPSWTSSGAHFDRPEDAVEANMVVAWHSFSRALKRCMSAAGTVGLSTTEIILLRHVLHRGKGQQLGDICCALNVSERHLVSYGLKKLLALELITTTRIGKEVFYMPTGKGEAVAGAFGALRSACLLPCIDRGLDASPTLAAQAILKMSEHFDQATRMADTLSAPCR